MRGNYALVLLLFTFAASPILTANCLGPMLTGVEFNSALNTGLPRAGKSTPLPVNEVRTVVIDAGHGGADPGGSGRRSEEKSIVLSVARLLRDGITANFPQVNVIMTRDDDTYIPLTERAQRANRAGADLFISIHANTAPNRGAFGTETWVMGNASAEYNLNVVRRENAAQRYDQGVEKKKTCTLVDKQLRAAQTASRSHSLTFAEILEHKFSSAGRNSRGVKRGNFVVLKCTTMPSVLVELGFMTNRTEETYLLTRKGQVELADAMLQAFTTYQELAVGNPQPQLLVATTQPSAPTVQDLAISQVNLERNARSDGAEDVYLPSSFGVQETDSHTPNTTPKTALIPLPSRITEEPAPPPIQQSGTAIQLAATSTPKVAKDYGWDQLGYTITETYDGELYRYQIRSFDDAPSAQAAAAALAAAGVENIVVAYAMESSLDVGALAATK